MADGNSERWLQQPCVTLDFAVTGQRDIVAGVIFGLPAATVTDYRLTRTPTGSAAASTYDMTMGASGVGNVVFAAGASTQLTIMKMVAGERVIVHGCTPAFFGVFHEEFFWVLSKKATLSLAEERDSINHIMENVALYNDYVPLKYAPQACW